MGTDVNYGEITRQLIGSLKKNNHFTLQTSSEVTDFKRNADNSRHVTIKNVQSGEAQTIDAKYVFIGGGARVEAAAKPVFRKRTTMPASRWAARS